MFSRVTVSICGVLIFFNTKVLAQIPPAADSAPRPVAAPDAGSMIQAASDLRKASEALVQFGAILERIAPMVADATVATSHEMAAMSEGFDPFGFKTSYQVIHEQNRMIQEQNAIIRELQQREIERLERELERLQRGE